MGFHCCAQVWSLVGELRSCKTRGAAPQKWGSWIVQHPTSFFSVSSWMLLFFFVFFLCMPYISLSSPPHSLSFFSSSFFLFISTLFSLLFTSLSPPTPPPPPPPSCSLSLSHLLFELSLSITIPSQVGEQTSNSRKYAGCLTSLQLTVLGYLLKT